MAIPYNGPFGGAGHEEDVASGTFNVTVRRWSDNGKFLIAASYRLNTEDGIFIFNSLHYPEDSIPWSEAVSWAEKLSAAYGVTPSIQNNSEPWGQ
ncbi:hypothetical protein [Azospirillum humicireducens]|uniref:hypothetical protein n=1 Tax=Azospirillum humicireducens TaxID=1226968 RepID=UPI0011B2091B|nr:hypothetical protein [Azospirillum humicireducens]